MSKLPPAPSKKNKKLNNRGTHSIFDKSGQKSSDKKHEMFTSTGGSGLGTGVLRPVKGNMDRDAVANDPNYLNKLMQNQQQQGMKSNNKMDKGIYIYKDGYTIGEYGEFKPITNENNAKFVASIKNGEIPEELEGLFKQKFGPNATDVDVNVVDRSKKVYSKPKKPIQGGYLGVNNNANPNFEAFKGTGNKLESKMNVDLDVSLDECESKEMKLDNSKEKFKIQIVLHNNKRVVTEINANTTILALYSHVKFISQYDGKFKLMSGVPPKALDKPNITAKDAGLKGARVIQKKIS